MNKKVYINHKWEINLNYFTCERCSIKMRVKIICVGQILKKYTQYFINNEWISPYKKINCSEYKNTLLKNE